MSRCFGMHSLSASVKSQSWRRESDRTTRLCLPQQGPLCRGLTSALLAHSVEELGGQDEDNRQTQGQY